MGQRWVLVPRSFRHALERQKFKSCTGLFPLQRGDVMCRLAITASASQLGGASTSIAGEQVGSGQEEKSPNLEA